MKKKIENEKRSFVEIQSHKLLGRTCALSAKRAFRIPEKKCRFFSEGGFEIAGHFDTGMRRHFANTNSIRILDIFF